MESQRSIRRHHVERLKENRSSFWGQKSLSEKQVGKAVHTATLCSCHMCGNPRKHFKDQTIQEKRMFQEVPNAD